MSGDFRPGLGACPRALFSLVSISTLATNLYTSADAAEIVSTGHHHAYTILFSASGTSQRAAMSHTGTMRGTPKNRNPPPPQFNNSPSGIPRPALETHASQVAQSDVGTSLSASRAKMSKRDDVITTRSVHPNLSLS